MQRNKYYQNLGRKLSDPNMGPKKYWSTLTRLINSKKTCNVIFLHSLKMAYSSLILGIKLVSLMNTLFSNVLQYKDMSSLPTFLPRINNQIKDITVSREKVLKLIRTLDTKKAHGCDEISVSMIKICDSSIVDPLCMIFEKCLSTGLYPSSWKKANIIPIHKKESKQSKKNYRPISLLPIFGKIFERLLFDDIYEHLNANRLLVRISLGFVLVIQL